MAMPKRTVFLEAFGEDDASVLSTIQTLPFASISTSSGQNTISDVDGKFTITTLAPIREFTISYIGYDKKITLVEN